MHYSRSDSTGDRDHGHGGSRQALARHLRNDRMAVPSPPEPRRIDRRRLNSGRRRVPALRPGDKGLLSGKCNSPTATDHATSDRRITLHRVTCAGGMRITGIRKPASIKWRELSRRQFHSCTIPLRLVMASRRPSGLNATRTTSLDGLVRVRRQLPVAGSHSPAVPSPPPVASRPPSAGGTARLASHLSRRHRTERIANRMRTTRERPPNRNSGRLVLSAESRGLARQARG